MMIRTSSGGMLLSHLGRYESRLEVKVYFQFK